jgi:hypothetical protein
MDEALRCACLLRAYGIEQLTQRCRGASKLIDQLGV